MSKSYRHRRRWQVAKCGDWTLVGTLRQQRAFAGVCSLTSRIYRHGCRWQVPKCGDRTLVGTLRRSERFFLFGFETQCFQCDLCCVGFAFLVLESITAIVIVVVGRYQSVGTGPLLGRFPVPKVFSYSASKHSASSATCVGLAFLMPESITKPVKSRRSQFFKRGVNSRSRFLC